MPNKTQEPAVAYLRVSSRGQVTGDGFTRQRRTIERRARTDGLSLVAEFTDEGVSGSKPLANRPGMSAMLDRILGNGVRCVLVEKSDRLARDLVEGELILRELRRAGVRVIEAEGGSDLSTIGDDNPTAKLIRQVLGAVAEFEKSALVARLRAARRRKRQAGVRVEGRKPYGPETVSLVKKLRRRKRSGKPWSFARIAAELDRMGIATKNGNPWSPSTVAQLLRGNTAIPRSVT